MGHTINIMLFCFLPEHEDAQHGYFVLKFWQTLEFKGAWGRMPVSGKFKPPKKKDRNHDLGTLRNVAQIMLWFSRLFLFLYPFSTAYWQMCAGSWWFVVFLLSTILCTILNFCWAHGGCTITCTGGGGDSSKVQPMLKAAGQQVNMCVACKEHVSTVLLPLVRNGNMYTYTHIIYTYIIYIYIYIL